MIDPKAIPLFNRSPYKRVDLSQRRRRVITRKDLLPGELEPSEAHYDYDEFYSIWTLRD